MDNIRKVVSAILDKADQLLTTEPARLIGYGAAVVIFLAVQGLGYVKPGLLPPLSFEAAIGDAFAAITTLVILVESIRRFVYSPATYIEDLSDESQAAHEAAHMEEDLAKWAETVRQHQQAKAAAAAAPQPITGIVSDVAPGDKGKSN